jgi:hypothetical protein
MPPLAFSRYQFSKGLKDASGDLCLTDPEPVRYQEMADNRLHTVVLGDTLQTLADRYFPGFTNAPQLGWVLADFQPEPITDPTLRLTTGRVLAIPSERFLKDVVFNESRREE